MSVAPVASNIITRPVFIPRFNGKQLVSNRDVVAGWASAIFLRHMAMQCPDMMERPETCQSSFDKLVTTARAAAGTRADREMGTFAKRFGFQRSNTAEANITTITSADSNSNPNSDSWTEKSRGITSAHQLTDETALEAQKKLKALERKHRWDPNLPADTLEDLDEAVHAHDLQHDVSIVGAFEENSPYPEVRAAVRNYDEDVPANTVRAWTIGLTLTTLGSAMNMLFSMRSPSISITSLVVQLVAWPIGIAWQTVLPNRQFRIGKVKFNLNPGPFNMKEHTIIVVMANASFGAGQAYATDTLIAQRAFYGQDLGWGFSLLLTLSTQMVGYGLAGVLRRFLVKPAAMIFPYTLVNTSLFYALHDRSPTDPSKANGWGISRYRYFFFVFLGSFVWYWFPGWIAQFLQVFAFVTWIKPDNVVINQLFGGSTGVSLIPITFDWTYISSYFFSPLIPPWHAIGNTLIGLVIFFWCTAIPLHYSGHWWNAYLPMSDSSSYDNTGSVYNVTRILTPDHLFDEAKYKAYSPLFLSTTFALAYGLSFAGISAVIVHTALFHGQEIWDRAKASKADEEDVHTRLMRKYPEAPDWWYAALLLTMLAFCFGTIYGYETHLTGWALVIALLIAAIWAIPIGMIKAITNIDIGLNVFTEFIIGYMQPGRPTAMMLFKTYGYITMVQAVYFIQDLKLGHYMKVPPRTMFMAQTIATIWSCFVQIAVMNWALGSITDICSRGQTSHFTCPQARVFFNASIIWGLIGPGRIFSPGQIYSSLLYFWIVGAFTPVIFYFVARKWPRSNLRYLCAPIIFSGTGYLPPATPLNYLSWGLIGWLFNKYIKNRFRGWWMRFNYVTSAGLDIGLAICSIVIFLTLQLTNQTAPQWWGNVQALNTADIQGTAVQKVVGDGETFGPPTW
ncbi:hypothetical protein MMC29_007655 [Sticta canariensis]|nr:hypothetical protein [Sticta canariensis]